jgi:hypothetical protein
MWTALLMLTPADFPALADHVEIFPIGSTLVE